MLAKRIKGKVDLAGWVLDSWQASHDALRDSIFTCAAEAIELSIQGEGVFLYLDTRAADVGLRVCCMLPFADQIHDPVHACTLADMVDETIGLGTGRNGVIDDHTRGELERYRDEFRALAGLIDSKLMASDHARANP